MSILDIFKRKTAGAALPSPKAATRASKHITAGAALPKPKAVTRASKRTTGSKSPGGLSRSGMTRIFDHVMLRRNARDAMYDSTVGRAIATRFADSVVDVGLRVKFEPDIEALPLSIEEAEQFSRKTSAAFNTWFSSKDSSRDGNNTGFQNQWLYAFSQQRDNDMYVRIHYNSDKTLISPVQIQFIDPDQLKAASYTSSDGKLRYINNGIKYDSTGREKSFAFMQVDAEGKYVEVEIPKRGKRSGRDFMIHGFKPEYAGQTAGFSLLSHCLQELENITTLSEAHIQKAINQSSWGFYTKPSQNAPASGGPSDFAGQSTEVLSDFFGADVVDSMDSSELATLTANVMEEFTIRQPGTLWSTFLNSGEDMKAVEQTAPADKFAEFVDSMVSYLSASCNMPIEVLKMKFSNNYSASRATLILFWRVVTRLRAEIKADFMDTVVRAWFNEEIAASRVKAPGYTDPRMKAAWLRYRLVGSALPSVDPLKELNAAKGRVEMGSTTLDDEALAYNGSDGQANRAKLKREMEELEIPPWGSNYEQNLAGVDGVV